MKHFTFGIGVVGKPFSVTSKNLNRKVLDDYKEIKNEVHVLTSFCDKWYVIVVGANGNCLLFIISKTSAFFSRNLNIVHRIDVIKI